MTHTSEGGDNLRNRAVRAWREGAERAAESRREQQEREREERHARYERDWRHAIDANWSDPTRARWYDDVLEALHFVLRRGEADAIKAAIRFLESDPWFHRSGYKKRDIIRRLTQLDLPEQAKMRLRRVVLQRIEHNQGQGFRHYCRLARAVLTPDFRTQIERHLNDEDQDVRRRARLVLESVDSRWVTPPPGRWPRQSNDPNRL